MPIIATYIVPHPPIMIPEVGRGEELKIAKTTTACREVMRSIAEISPDIIVITTPHVIMYGDYFHISPNRVATGSLEKFSAADVVYNGRYDVEFVNELEKIATEEGIAAGTLGERDAMLDHGTLVPLYFLKETGFDCPIVRIGLSGLSPTMHYRLGQCIAKASDRLNKRVVIIASGDLSHKLTKEGPYGFASEGPEFDKKITKVLEAGDFFELLSISPQLADAAAECGLKSFQIMAGALDRKSVTANLLSYEGPFGVGYAVASFELIGDDDNRNFGEQIEAHRKQLLDKMKSREDSYVSLARLSLETYIKMGEYAKIPDNLPTVMLNTRAGAFVSLKKDGILRGCIGTIAPVTSSIADEILRNAISAAVEDTRFDPVSENELDELVYSVDVLGEIESINSPDELDVNRYGVIVESGMRRGLLLPNLEGVDTVDAQIRIAKQKAGIKENEQVKLSRFEVVRHK